jgi:hypothetical protein
VFPDLQEWRARTRRAAKEGFVRLLAGCALNILSYAAARKAAVGSDAGTRSAFC